MKRLSVFCIAVLLGGCAATPGFVIQPAQVATFAGQRVRSVTSTGNRVSRVAFDGGLLFQDASGIYLNPFVARTRTGKLVAVGFNVVNRIDNTGKSLHVFELGRIEAIAFRLGNGTVITLPVNAQATATREVETAEYAYLSRYDKRETGVALATPADLRTLANARGVAVKITGSRRSVTYNAAEVLPAFLANIRKFYAARIERRPLATQRVDNR